MNAFAAGWQDVLTGWRSSHAWGTLAWDDIASRYRRTLLGPIWLTLSHALWVFGMAYVFSQIFKTPFADYTLYMAAGLTIWMFLSGCLADAPMVFVRASNFIQSYDLAISIHAFRLVASHLTMFAHYMLVVAIAYVVSATPLSWNILWFLPACAIVLVACTGIVFLLGVLGARFRDVGPAIGSLLTLAMLITPIFWRKIDLPADSPLLVFNPLHHLIEICRAPLMGQPPDLGHWQLAGASAVLLLAAGLLLFSRYRRSLPFWI